MNRSRISGFLNILNIIHIIIIILSQVIRSDDPDSLDALMPSTTLLYSIIPLFFLSIATIFAFKELSIQTSRGEIKASYCTGCNAFFVIIFAFFFWERMVNSSDSIAVVNQGLYIGLIVDSFLCVVISIISSIIYKEE